MATKKHSEMSGAKMLGIGVVGALVLYAIFKKPSRTAASEQLPPVPPPPSSVPSSYILTAADHAFIRLVQDRLRELGYTPGPTTGDWNHDTDYALAFFQRDNGLPANGIMDGATATRIQARYEALIASRYSNRTELQTALDAARAAWDQALADIAAGARQGFGSNTR